MAAATKRPNAKDDILGTGRRKTSVARVRLRPGTGQITINSRPMDEYFHNVQQHNAVLATLVQTGKRDEVDVGSASKAAASPARPTPSSWAWPAP